MSVVFSALMHFVMFSAVASNSVANSDGSAANHGTANLTTTAGTVTAVASGDSHTYAAAYHETQENGKPMLILVGATWCPACQSMKTSTMPQVAAKGELQHVAFAYVNVDAQHELAGQLLEGNSIPQLVMYQKVGDGWTLKRLVGAQSVEDVEGFLGPAATHDVVVKQPDAKNPAAANPAATNPATATSPAAKTPAAAQQSSTAAHSVPTG